MGGQGSGRPPSTETIIKRVSEPLTPIAQQTGGDALFLPNYSGLKPAALKNSSGSLNGIPVGTIVMWAGVINETTNAGAPLGWQLCNGDTLFFSTWTELYAAIGTTFNDGTESEGKFRIPDFRGIFPRGFGTNRTLKNANGIAFSGTLGTYQNDKLQGHVHSPPGTNSTYWGNYAGPSNIAGGTTTAVNALSQTGNPASDGTNGSPRTGAETNPANLGINFIIKYTSLFD